LVIWCNAWLVLLTKHYCAIDYNMESMRCMFGAIDNNMDSVIMPSTITR